MKTIEQLIADIERAKFECEAGPLEKLVAWQELKASLLQYHEAAKTKTNEVLNKIVRKKVIWAEIKAKEQEYNRLCKQIEEIEQAKRDLSFEIQKRLEESQSIADWLLDREYESLVKDTL